MTGFPTADQINAAAIIVCDERQRAILHLVYNENQSLRATARTLGYHHSTIIAQHYRALELIRTHLEGEAA